MNEIMNIYDRVRLMNDCVNTQNANKYEQRLVKVDRSILRVPNLCIHLKTPEERNAFEVNKGDVYIAPYYLLCNPLKLTSQ